ncbi:MAG: glycine oxidase [Oleispira sp.]
MKSEDEKSRSGIKIAILGGGLVGRLLSWRLASGIGQLDLGVISDNDILDNDASGDPLSARNSKKIKDTKFDNGITVNNTINRFAFNKISVFEKGLLAPPANTDRAAAFTAAAMISPLSELVSSELDIYTLGVHSLTLWTQWLKELGIPQHFHQKGSLVLAHPNDIAELHQFKRDLEFKLDQQNASKIDTEADTKPAALQVLNERQHLENLEPAISQHFNTGLYLPNEAHIDHNEVLEELVTQAKKWGVNFAENCALEPNDEALKDYDIIFDCRGKGLKATGFRGVRGEVIRIECKEVTLKRPIRLMHPRYKLYIVPKPHHQYVIGATEIESEDRSNISLRSSMELMSALYAVSPAFAESRIISQETNLRPAYLNNLPRIDRLQSIHHKPIIRINGLYRHGYLIGPAIIEQAIQQVFL